jgi:hypothetical protein
MDFPPGVTIFYRRAAAAFRAMSAFSHKKTAVFGQFPIFIFVFSVKNPIFA